MEWARTYSDALLDEIVLVSTELMLKTIRLLLVALIGSFHPVQIRSGQSIFGVDKLQERGEVEIQDRVLSVFGGRNGEMESLNG